MPYGHGPIEADIEEPKPVTKGKKPSMPYGHGPIEAYFWFFPTFVSFVPSMPYGHGPIEAYDVLPSGASVPLALHALRAWPH